MITRGVRAGLLIAGIWLCWYGVTLLLHSSSTDLRSIAIWFAAGILVHDAAFAPAAAAIGLAGRRLLPRAWWAPTACGAVCTVAAALIAAPVLGRHRALADNPTVLDRNYVVGFVAMLVVVWALVAVVVLIARRRHTDPG